MIITIDGPTASGKSTAARKLSKKLGFRCLSSGSIYRAVAYLLIEECGYTQERLIDPQENDIRLILDDDRLRCGTQPNDCGITLFDGHDVTRFLKTEKISQAASIIATNKMVRGAINALLRRLADNYDLVAEGRDMGSVVFAHADIKFFLTASVEVRAHRWQKVQEKTGHLISMQEAKKQIESRDERDSKRIIAPLIVAPGAIVIDTSSLSIEQVIDSLYAFVQEKMST